MSEQKEQFSSIYNLLQFYVPKVFGGNGFVAPNISEKKLNGCIKGIAKGNLIPNDILAIDDSTLFGSATDGIIFTQDKMLISGRDGLKDVIINYKDIKDAIYEEIIKKDKEGKEVIDKRICTLITTNNNKYKFNELSQTEDLKNFFIELRDNSEMAIKRENVENKPLEELSIESKLAYIKIIINFLMEDEKISTCEFSKLYNLIVRLKIDSKTRKEIMEYKNNLESTNELLNYLFKHISEVIHEQLKFSIIKDMIYIYQECNNNSYDNSLFIKEMISKLDISQQQIDLIIKTIDSDKKLFDDNINDDGLTNGIKELSKGAAAVGVPMAALYFSGAVTGLGATGITSGLASLGFGGLLGFSSMATGLGTLLLLGYGAKKGADVITGKGEIDKRKRKEAMLLEVNRNMQRSINCIVEDINDAVAEVTELVRANQKLGESLEQTQINAKETILKLAQRNKHLEKSLSNLSMMSSASTLISEAADYSESCAIRQRVPYHLDRDKLQILTQDPTRQEFKDIIEGMYEEKDGEMLLRKDLSREQVEVLSALLQRIEYFSVSGSINSGLNLGLKKMKGFFNEAKK